MTTEELVSMTISKMPDSMRQKIKLMAVMDKKSMEETAVELLGLGLDAKRKDAKYKPIL